MNKVYALYFNEREHKIEINCNKQWEKEEDRLKGHPTTVVKYNDFIMLSHSRKSLVALGNEIRNIWLKKQYDIISKIANIDLK